MARLGVSVRFTDAPGLDQDDPQARLLTQVQGVIAEYERNADVGILLDMPSPRLCRSGLVPGGFELLRPVLAFEGVGIIAVV
jgi:hypothetical protein